MGILLDKTADCPYINFSAQECVLEIEGRSIMEDVYSFWQPLVDWVSDYVMDPSPKTSLIFALEYTNSSSNKYISEILKQLERCHKDGKVVEVYWRYEDDDESIYMLGQDMEALVSMKFKFEEVELERLKSKKIKIRSKKTGNEATITYRYWDAIIRNGHGQEYTILDET